MEGFNNMLIVFIYIHVRGITRKQAAVELGVPYSTLCGWLQRKAIIPQAEFTRILHIIRQSIPSIDVFNVPGWVSVATCEAIATILAVEFRNFVLEEIGYFFPEHSKRMDYLEFLRMLSSFLPDGNGNKGKEVKSEKLVGE